MRLEQVLEEWQPPTMAKASIAYLVISWLLIQVPSILLLAFVSSPIALKSNLLIPDISFPIGLVIAFVCDFYSEGIKTSNADSHYPELSKKKKIGFKRFIIGDFSKSIIPLIFSMNTIRSIHQKVLEINYSTIIKYLTFYYLRANNYEGFFRNGFGQKIIQRLNLPTILMVINFNSSTIQNRKYCDKWRGI